MCCKVDISDPLPPLRTYDILNILNYIYQIYIPHGMSILMWCALDVVIIWSM